MTNSPYTRFDYSSTQKSGKYPNTVVHGNEFRPIYEQMVAGDGPENELRIRTTHRSEQHTFVFPLGGFVSATSKGLGRLRTQQ